MNLNNVQRLGKLYTNFIIARVLRHKIVFLRVLRCICVSDGVPTGGIDLEKPRFLRHIRVARAFGADAADRMDGIAP